MADVALKVAGQAFIGWESARITSSMDAVCPAFEIAYADRSSYGVQPRRIRRGDECEIAYRGKTVLRGYVNAVSDSRTASERTLTVSGRSKTQDLVDCSVQHDAPWAGKSIVDIARDVVRPFGISVEYVLDQRALTPITYVRAEPGESCIDLLGRVCRARGTRIQTTEKGALWLVQNHQRAVGRLELGKNILAIERTISDESWFSQIEVLIQNGDIALQGVEHVSAKVEDPLVRRFRPLILVSDILVEDLATRAAWEVNTRIGQGLQVRVETPGWTSSDGYIWRPCDTVHVVDPERELDDNLAIASVELRMDLEGGTTTTLDLTDPAILSPDPVRDLKMGDW